MTGEKETNALLPIVGALWVSGNVAVNATQVINERRDVIMSGVLGGTRLSLFHRQTILYDDWLPQVIVSVLGCVILTVFFVIVPMALKLNRSYRILCLVCATIPAVGALSWCLQGIAEYNMMQSLLANEAGAPAAAAG